MVTKVPSESLLEDLDAGLLTIPAVSITETNKLIYETEIVIPEVTGYKLKMRIKGQ